MKTQFLILPVWLVCVAGIATAQTTSATGQTKDQIIEKYLTNGAHKFHPYSKQWQEEIDKGLKVDSTIAYLWQQKAMPLYKQKRYSEGLPFLDKAVLFDRERYLDYRGFMKCIFAKDYRGAVEDFTDCLTERGNSYVMDHSYKFYLALSYIQLRNFTEAERLLAEDTQYVGKTRGEAWVHHLDLLYLGISQYEQGKHGSAIKTFDDALKLYAQFSEVHYYKALAMKASGNKYYEVELKLAKDFFNSGHTINEDNAIYEKYPYQLSAATFQ